MPRDKELNLDKLLECLCQIVQIIFPLLTIGLCGDSSIRQILPPRFQLDPLLSFILQPFQHQVMSLQSHKLWMRSKKLFLVGQL